MGLPTYLATVARELIAYRPTRLRARVDNKTVWEGQALLLAIANAQSYGAGMRIAPMARIDDGLLNVVLVEHVSRLNVVRSFPRVFSGTHLTHPAVHTWEGREVTIETPDGPAPALVDGDVQCQTPLTVRMSPGRATLLLPGAEDDAALSEP
jgi:diacylglycerol kinase (ATP)